MPWPRVGAHLLDARMRSLDKVCYPILQHPSRSARNIAPQYCISLDLDIIHVAPYLVSSFPCRLLRLLYPSPGQSHDGHPMKLVTNQIKVLSLLS